MAYIAALKVTSPITFTFSDHNRSTIPLGYEQIENVQRMANGSMRKYVIATKKSFSVSWEMLPSRTNMTVDGNAGAEALKDFYETYYKQPLTVELKYHKTPGYSSDSSSTTMETETLQLFISSFSYDIVKRLKDSDSTGFDYVNVSIGFTEI